MRHARSSRWSALFAPPVLAALAAGSLTAGCAGGEPPGTFSSEDGVSTAELPYPNGQPHGVCEAYRSQGADLYGYCVYRYVGGVRTAEELAGYCAAAGDWEHNCRHSWVSGKMNPASSYSTEALLEACGPSVDCSFELIDMRVSDDVLEQIDRCGKYAGRYAGDCVSHAMQRWYQSKPDPAEFDRVIQFEKQFYDKVGHWAGAVVRCHGVGECPEDDRVGKFCRHAVRTFDTGHRQCPSLKKDPLPHNQGSLRSQPTGRQAPRPAAKAPSRPPKRPPGTRPQGTPRTP